MTFLNLRSGTFGAPFDAPTIEWTSNTEDTTPTFNVTPFGLGQWLVGDVVTLYRDDGGGAESFTDTVDTVNPVNTIDFATGVWPVGAYDVWMTITRSGYTESPASNVEVVTITAVAPTLSAPIDTAAGLTAGVGSVTTNDATGTLYWVISTSATQPSRAQVKAGQTHSGSAATDSGSQAVTATGIQPISGGFTGLSASSTYYAHFMHEDEFGNQSSVASGDGFSTNNAQAWAPTSSPPIQAIAFTLPTATFSDVAVNNAQTSDVIVVRITSSGNRTLTSVTIDGHAMTKAIGAGGNDIASIWYITGYVFTAAEIIITAGNNLDFVGIDVGILVGVTAAPTDTDSMAFAYQADPQAAGAVTVPANGFALAVAGAGSASDPTWGGTGVTEDVDKASGSDWRHTSAKSSTAGSVTAQITGWSFQGVTIAVAVWGP